MRKAIFIIFSLFVLLSSRSVVLALDPMGPPVAGLKKGRFGAGAEYSNSTMDVKLNEGKGNWRRYQDGVLIGSASGELPSYVIKNLSLNKAYANLGYGITDNWEIFLRLGAADIDYEYKDELTLSGFKLFPTGKDENGDSGFAIGFGSKATFYEKDKLRLGGLFQISWAQSDGKQTGIYGDCPDCDAVWPAWEQPKLWSNYVDVEITEIQIALGPTYQLMEKVFVYGGPFFHFIDGNVDSKYSESGTGLGSTLLYLTDHSYDIDGRSTFGGYVGIQVGVIGNASFNIEYQYTPAADAMGMNLIWRF